MMEEHLYEAFSNTLSACTKLEVVRGVDFFEITDDNGIVHLLVDFRNKEYTPTHTYGTESAHICCPKNATDVVKVFIDLGIFEINDAFILKKWRYQNQSYQNLFGWANESK